MEAQQSILEMINNKFGKSLPNIAQYSPLTLAYIGDAVYDLIVRTLLVEQANIQVKKLHKKAIEIVKAKSQANLIAIIKMELTEEEQCIFKRGRNAKTNSVAKNAKFQDYRNATGFETLLGHLYLTGHLDRALELIMLGMTRMKIQL